MIKVDECDPLGELEPSFPYRDVQIRRGTDINEFYEMQTEIGRGKFGTVYRCREKATGLQLAAKFVATPRRDDRRNVEREVEIMRRLQHPRLIQLYDAFDSNGKAVCLVLEIIEGGELFERVIDDDFVLTEKACTIFMRQICEGIEFIHRQNILHLDMKPENIMCLTKTGNRIKIIDFGLARKFDPQKKLQVLFGTPEFVAPEVVNFDQIGYGTDMWSVGVICYVLLSGLSPFMGETDIETMANVTIAKYDFDDEAFNEISEDAKDFIRKLLLKDKELRMSSSQCLAHSWLKRSPLPPAPPPRIIPAPEELDVTKDNLRSFVERWSEHPDSPYVFDTTCQSICPLPTPNLLLSASHHSLHGMSPSPCGSLSSSSSQESVLEAETHIPPCVPTPDESYYHYAIDKKGIQPPPWYINRLLHERRASDSTCIVSSKNAGGGELSRVNLVDEIRKLSDRLFQMASQQHTPTNTFKEKEDSVINNDNMSLKVPGPSVVTGNPQPTEQHRRNSDVPWRRSTFLAGPLSGNSTCLSNKASEEDMVRRPKFKITAFARDVPIAPPATRAPELKQQSNNNPPTTSVTTSHSLRWGIPISTPTYSRTFSRTSTSSTASSSSSISPRESIVSPLPRCPSSSSSSSYSAPHSPVQTPRQNTPEVKADLTEDLLSHLLDRTRWECRTDGVETMTKVVRTEERSRKALSMEWSQVEMTMESLGQRTMKSLAKILETSSSDPSNGKDILGSKERQTLARNLSQLGV